MRWLSWLGVVMACVVVAGALGFYKYTEIQAAMERAAAFPEPADAVEVYVVERVERQPNVEVTGEVVATRSATLRNELKGRIVDVGFAPGARVEAGQVLVRLDVSQEQAQLAEARADLQIARLALERAQRLVRSGAGSVENRDQARAQFDAANARVNALIALIDKKTLRAPFAAITSLHELEPGQLLDEGTAITELVGVADNIWVDFALPQENARIAVGSDVDLILETGGAPLAATVVARDAAINVRSRNLRLRAELPAEAADLLPGMLVRVRVPLAATRSVVVVPATAVRRDSLGTSVYVIEAVDEGGQARHRARKRRVTLANLLSSEAESDTVIVAEGLQAGEQIAAIGAFKLRDGGLVVPGEAEPGVEDRLVGH